MLHALLLAAVTTLSPADIHGMLANAEKAFHDYVFQDVGAKAAAMLKTNATKYESISDPKTFKKTVDADLYGVTHDKHVRLWYPFAPQDSPEDNSPATVAAHHREELNNNFGFRTVRRLPGNVGYIDFRSFSGDVGLAQTAQAAMTFLANTDALIIDLRHNGGGDPVAAETIEGYFFSSQQQITSLKWRDPKTGVTNEVQQYTAPTVPGPLYLEKPIYLLTSAHTFSCAEQFTYDLHNLKRVTIVGETTGGGANPGAPHGIGHSFAIFIPEGRAYSPVTKTNWESTGIAPDVPVTANDALQKAYTTALDYVKAHVTNADIQDEVTEALADPQKALAP